MISHERPNPAMIKENVRDGGEKLAAARVSDGPTDWHAFHQAVFA